MNRSQYEVVARELVRALRGRRSQAQLSRRLGYRSNALHTWEAGVAFPPASRLFELATKVGCDLEQGLLRFYRRVPGSLRGAPLTSPEGIKALLGELRGHTRMGAIAESSGLSRFAIGRWLAGKAEPNLPDLLCFVEHTSLRLLDFIAIFVDPATVPSLAADWKRLQAARMLGYEAPAAHAVLRALETTAYQKRPTTQTLARLTGLPAADIDAYLTNLQESDQVRLQRGRLVTVAEAAVDFRREPERAQRVKAYWAQLAAERTLEPRPGLFAFNVFACSRKDLKRLEELQRAYLTEMRTIIAASEPSEVVALANLQLFALED